MDFKATSVQMDGKDVQLQVWDTAGQERFRALTTSYYRGAHGVILVYDVTSQASFDHLASWIKDVDLYSGEEARPRPRPAEIYRRDLLEPRSRAETSRRDLKPRAQAESASGSHRDPMGITAPRPGRAHAAARVRGPDVAQVIKLLIGNKDDDTARKVVDPAQAREFAKDHSMLFMEASAMRAINVSAAFKLLVAEVMHQADTIASQPPAFEHKLKVNAERSRRAQSGCAGMCN